MIQARRKQLPENAKLDNEDLPGSNKRKNDEPFGDYKVRRMVQNNPIKLYLKGKVFWNSKEVGTYVKEK